MKTSIDVGLIVQDVQSSLEFYMNILGCVPAGEIALPFGHLYRLSFGDSVLKLLLPASKAVARPASLTERVGIQYITLQISNIDDFNQSIMSRQIPIEIPLQELLPGLKVIMIRDPDGNIIELIERS